MKAIEKLEKDASISGKDLCRGRGLRQQDKTALATAASACLWENRRERVAY